MSRQNKLQREIEFHNQRYESESENRAAAGKYYRLKKIFDEKLLNIIKKRSKGKKILEIGCGPKIVLPYVVDTAEECHGIDISDIAIEQARTRLGGSYKHVFFSVMNVEAMDFEDDYFDVVCGNGIIHHLDIRSAYREISRVLKPEGVAVFIEPLGHNPFINTYRKLTPGMRSVDEHPLLMEDIQLASEFFGEQHVDFQHILSIISAYIPGSILHNLLFLVFDSVDKAIIKLLPFTKKYCWMVLLVLEKPVDKKSSP